MSSTINPLLEAKGITKYFGTITALENVNLKIHAGECLGVVGDNGAGKSTLMKVLSGLYKPSAGSLFFQGKEEILESPRDSQNLGLEMVYQDLALAGNLPIGENIFLGREPTKNLGFIKLLDFNKIKSFGFKPVGLNQMFKTCEIIYVLAAVTTKNKNLVNKNLINKMKRNSLFILMSRAAVVNFKDLINRVKKGDIYVATDVFPEEPVRKSDPIRKLKNILFSAHRAGALTEAFFAMGDIVLKDMHLISKNLKPKFCKKAELKTVGLLASKPVAIN